ncbi:hypothetical protein ACEN88_30910 [Massilia sp. CT11-108]|uniref:hypothetical protein n=1 Tax=Massilia sp. CT11-108 TaxID=3393900 RepID=UPI0039A526D0
MRPASITLPAANTAMAATITPSSRPCNCSNGARTCATGSRSTACRPPSSGTATDASRVPTGAPEDASTPGVPVRTICTPRPVMPAMSAAQPSSTWKPIATHAMRVGARIGTSTT